MAKRRTDQEWKNLFEQYESSQLSNACSASAMVLVFRPSTQNVNSCSALGHLEQVDSSKPKSLKKRHATR